MAARLEYAYIHGCLYVLACDAWLAVLQCSTSNIKNFRALFHNWMTWRQMAGDRWKVLIDIINPAKTSQIGYWLLHEDDRGHRYLLSELIVAISNSHGTSDKKGSIFCVGQRVTHTTSGPGTIVAIDMSNLRDRPYEISFDTGQTHQYTETALMQKFTLELTKEDAERLLSPTPLSGGLQRPVHAHEGNRAGSAPALDNSAELACSPLNNTDQAVLLAGASIGQRPCQEKADECAQLRRQLSELQEQLQQSSEQLRRALSAQQALEEQLNSSRQRMQPGR